MVAVLLEASGGRGEVDPTSEPPTRPQSQQPPIRLADAAHGASLAALHSPAYAALRACASLPTVGRGQQWSLASGNVWRMDNTRPSRGRGFFTAADLAASVPRTSAIGS